MKKLLCISLFFSLSNVWAADGPFFGFFGIETNNPLGVLSATDKLSQDCPGGSAVVRLMAENFNADEVTTHSYAVLFENNESKISLLPINKSPSIKEKFLNKFKNLEIKFKNSEFIYLLIYRFIGGIPWQLSCLLPTLFNVKISNSEIGIVSKDKSDVNINNSSFENNKLDFASFVKKGFFGASKAKFNSSLPSTYLIENGSTIIGLEKVIYSNKVEKKLYGNMYGRASK